MPTLPHFMGMPEGRGKGGHDMAAIKLPKKKVHLFPLRVYGKVVILQAEINRGTVR